MRSLAQAGTVSTAPESREEASDWLAEIAQSSSDVSIVRRVSAQISHFEKRLSPFPPLSPLDEFALGPFSGGFARSGGFLGQPEQQIA